MCNRVRVYSALIMALILACVISITNVTARVGDGRVTSYSDGVRIGSELGTKITLIKTLRFTFDDSATSEAALPGALPGDDYAIVDGWQSATSDPGLCVISITTDTLTMTTQNATTGMAYALLISEQ